MIKRCFYRLKPLMPRPMQLFLRRALVHAQMRRHRGDWPIDPAAAAAPPLWAGWPDGKRFALVLTHDVDTARGARRCLPLSRLEEALGFRSAFNFVAERYEVPPQLRHDLAGRGFEVGVHGLKHDGKYFESRQIFLERAARINHYLKEWGAVGFRTPSMLHRLDWISDLDILWDASTFDTDPFEPQPDGVRTIFPFFVPGKGAGRGFVELPYTLPQDFTLFVLMRQRTIDIWKRKTDWIAQNGGMVLVNVHPDYMRFNGDGEGHETFPARYYEEFLRYIQESYAGQYWHVLPRVMAETIRGRAMEAKEECVCVGSEEISVVPYRKAGRDEICRKGPHVGGKPDAPGPAGERGIPASEPGGV